MRSNNTFSQLQLLAGGLALAFLGLHFYYFCNSAFMRWQLTSPIVTQFATHLSGPFHHRAPAKLIVLFFSLIALTGFENSSHPMPKRTVIRTLALGMILYFGGDIFLLPAAQPIYLNVLYIVTTLAGLTCLCIVLQQFTPLITNFFATSVFNDANETFPQQERLLQNPESIHLKATYRHRRQTHKSIINLDVYPGTIIMGKPGMGKTRYIFRQMIRQSLLHNMALFVYDLKYPALTRLTYNTLRSVHKDSQNQPAFYSVNFDDFGRSHRCNPIDPATLTDISDAAEIARTLLLAINPAWIDKQGDFWVESAISFFTANIWFLRQFAQGLYCTLPHLIELLNTPYDQLLSILSSEPQCETRITSFAVAYQEKTMEQLQGQIDSARIPLASLASPQFYYLLSENDFSLDINNPNQPKVFCLGSNPQKSQTLGAVVSLYISRMLRMVNRPGGHPCHIFADEFTSFYAPGMMPTIAVSREYKVAVTIGIQDFSQLRAVYGSNQADAMFNVPGNIISGAVTGDSARMLADRFPRILQQRSTVSANSRDTSTSQSLQLDRSITTSKIAMLSSGEFIGITADNPARPNKLKAFHCKLDIDNAAIAREEATWEMPPVIREVSPAIIQTTFEQIKEETRDIVRHRLAQMTATPGLTRYILKKNRPSKRQKRKPE